MLGNGLNFTPHGSHVIKLLVGAAILATMPTFSLAEGALEPGSTAYIRASGRVILHEAPTNSSTSVSYGRKGDQVTILDREDDWFQVMNQSGSVGWVSDIFLVASDNELRARPKSQAEKDAEIAGMAIGAGLVVCLITGCLKGNSDTSSSSTIHFANNCSEDIKVAVHYLDTDDKWRTRGWFELEASESKDLYYVNETLRTKNSILYFYAQSLDGDTIWRGDTLVEFGDEDLNMKRYQTETGNMRLSLNCQ